MRFTIPLLALAAAAVPATASAQAAEQVVTVRISAEGIDLSTEAGRAELEAKISAKLRKACTVKGATRLQLKTVDESCLADARDAASAQAERIASAQTRSSGAIAAN
ncbi:MAG: UrcA family protein [Pseudomonadota bacterium]